MWLVGSKRPSLVVYLSLDGFVAIQGDRILQACALEVKQDSAEALKRWLMTSTFKGELRFFLSGGLCRAFIANVPESLTNQEADLAWRAAAVVHTGLSNDCHVWRDSSSSANGKVAAVVETVVFDKLQRLAQLPGRLVSVASIQPAWSEWLKASLIHSPSSTCAVLHETDSTTILAGEGGQFELATCLVGAADVGTTQAAIDRLLLVTDCVKDQPRQARIGLKVSPAPFNKDSALNLLMEEVR